ncbi:MAG TPA: DUF58 domain-containing protein [Solirubrobacteraceae bacterium]|nr:DUF58 domain-containing protein [Solirubrobacteraceae bacterium]
MRRAAAVALAGVLLTLAAFTFDAASLFVPGVAFILLGTVTPLWVWASAQSATVQRRLLAERVIEGEPVEAMIEVRRGPLGLPGGEVLDPLAGTPVSLSRPLSIITGGAKADVRVVARFPRRGLRRLAPPRLVVRDMLELASTSRPGIGAVQELLVLPRVEPVRWTARDRGQRAEGASARPVDEPFAAVDIDGLRPYRPGTPASRIHWAAFARGAGLLERRLRADGDTRPLVVLDARNAGPEEHLDAAVRAAASLTLELARRGGCRLLLPGERRTVAVEPDLVSWPALHARLALVEGGSTARPPILTPGARFGPMFYVAAQSLERLPPALTGAGGAALVLVVPAALAHRTSTALSFEVAGCRGYAIRARGALTGERAA